MLYLQSPAQTRQLLLVVWLILCFYLVKSPGVAQEPTTTQEPGSQFDCEVIQRVVPPVGLDIPSLQWSAWLSEIQTLETEAAKLDSRLLPDVEILLKACRYAVEFQELYQDKDFAKVDRLLALAVERIDAIKANQADWPAGAGRQIRGFHSRVDGSPQPVGLILPDDWQTLDRPLPLYVWLHGRGDKTTDIHFLCERLDKDGQIKPPGAIVLHPFGRQCLGYKSVGETDVLEAIDFAVANYPIDPERIVLMGFSMGGAGVWHLAAHYGDRFIAASPGAGFAETARYQNIQPPDYPPQYEQLLWRIYDVPGYTQNLFNLPLVAYSGELDKQIQAARVMEEAYAAEGRKLTHLIGPGMEHKYHPDTLNEILRRLAAVVERGQPKQLQQFFIQAPHPRYAQRAWLAIDGPIEQYQDTRATATQTEDSSWEIRTSNVRRLRIDHSVPGAPSQVIRIDGSRLPIATDTQTLLERHASGEWSTRSAFPERRKHPGLSGPIDDAFIDPFLIVLPSGRSSHPQVEQWVQCELANFQQRWQTLFRGNLRTKLDSQVTEDDMAQYHLVIWGDLASNSLLAHLLQAETEISQQTIRWSSSELQVGQQHFDASQYVPLAIRPNPLSPGRYMVINSGPTFRQAHDRTNSLQNPHLPDWAIVSLAERPSADRPGKIVTAGFFDDSWRLDANLTW